MDNDKINFDQCFVYLCMSCLNMKEATQEIMFHYLSFSRGLFPNIPFKSHILARAFLLEYQTHLWVLICNKQSLLENCYFDPNPCS
jgi:hypothetical protein